MMTRAIAHRGPDDAGHAVLGPDRKDEWTTFQDVSPDTQGYRLALGHRRLAILDLTQAGHQPMQFKQCWVTYNGEIYNYLELTAELQQLGHSFCSHSDTEVLLHAYAEWGVECLMRLNGIFAFALWDGRRKLLFAARDRFGVKPLYYSLNRNRLLLCSEIKGILPLLGQPPRIHDDLVYDFLVHERLDHTDDTFFSGIRRLHPGTFLIADGETVRHEEYYSLPSPEELQGSLEENALKFKSLLSETIGLQMRSDVPVGCCLSGGLDSSSIVCLASKVSPHRLKTFTARYWDTSMDEWEYAQAVHRHAAAEPFWIFAEPEEAFQTLAQVVRAQEEPFAGPGILVQWELFKLIQDTQIKVVLDGQGGDELLCGYAKYFYLAMMLNLRNHHFGRAARAPLEALVHYQPQLLNWRGARRYMPRLIRPRGLSKALNMDFLKGTTGRDTGYPGADVRAMQVADITLHSLPILLRYEDKNSMAHSIESRVPFLDHRLVEFAYLLPTDQKIIGSLSKVILRKALSDVLPHEISQRRSKLGFGGTYASWVKALKRPLQSFFRQKELRIERYISPSRMEQFVLRNDAAVFNPVILEYWMREFHVN